MSVAKRLKTGLAEVWGALRTQFTAGRLRRRRPVNDPASLERFLYTRASYVAQTSLYGYLKARAGTRYPELFADDVFAGSINNAKWQIWLACLADLCVYTGGLVFRRVAVRSEDVTRLMMQALDAILDEAGIPADAGPEFAAAVEAARQRVRKTQWALISDDATPFSESPLALVQWAPVIDEFKRLDEEIVSNSVRFRWQEVRRDLRASLDAEALLAATGK